MKRNHAGRMADKLALKRLIWIRRTAEALGVAPDEAERLLSLERQQSIRVNSLQLTERSPATPQWLGKQYAWMPEGFELNVPVADVRDDERVLAGQYFIQNAASWLPVLALDAQPQERILDVCAAPGGKTSHIAAATDNRAHITANDNSRPRLAKLRANLDRLGANVERYTLYDATALAHKLEGEQFDRILIDAPCSGEGLMNLINDKDFATWSVAHIKRLQQLQKRIIIQAWQLLAPGGTLVYSTCTMAPEENEAVVDYLLRSRENASVVPFEVAGLPNRVPAVRKWNGKRFSPSVDQCMRLKPSRQIEAFFVCKLQKTSQAD